MRDLAQRLLAAEAASQSAGQPHVHEALRVCEKLRISLTRFAGADGFTSLLRRSLTIARADLPALRAVHLGPDGSLEGLDELAAEASGGGDDVGDAAIAITANLLALLATFIGKPFTLRLVGEAWPDTSLDE
ncbi:MAG: hypothetical protein ACR2OZ_16995 [Verrucomicrobiales bacterium]